MLSAVLSVYALSAVAQVAVEISEPEVAQHRLGPPHVLRIPPSVRQAWPPRYVKLAMLVVADGSVLSARPVSGDELYYSEASRLAMGWKYTPFERGGSPVIAKFEESVSILPPEKRPVTPVSFPDIADWKSLRITLDRSACFGSCPDYSLEVHGDGKVFYSGRSFVKYRDAHSGRISASAVREIVSAFRAADFFWLMPEYAAGITDLPMYTTSISFDGKKMSVRDYAGQIAGMPLAVEDVENTIDRLAGPESWIH